MNQTKFSGSVNPRVKFTVLKNAVHQAVYSKNIIIESKLWNNKTNQFQLCFRMSLHKSLLPPTSLHDFEEIIQHHIFENKIEKPYDDYNCTPKVSEEDKLTVWKENPTRDIPTLLKVSRSRISDLAIRNCT